jgi:hypothetical protein
MDETYVFRRKAAGDAEAAKPTNALSPKHRRCLLLIDGRNSIRDVAANFRPGELGPVLRELVERGFLEAPAEGVAGIDAATGHISFIDEAAFLRVQQRAMRELADKLGAAGGPIVMQVEACARPEQLRIALRSIEKALQAVAGADYARDFVKRVGRELMGS